MKTRYIMCGTPLQLQRFKARYSSILFKLEEKPFKSCKATVGLADEYIYLRSYDTVVAFIDTRGLAGYDILRTDYRYTATSAQHIAKFFKYYESYVGAVLRTDYKDGRTITKVMY